MVGVAFLGVRLVTFLLLGLDGVDANVLPLLVATVSEVLIAGDKVSFVVTVIVRVIVFFNDVDLVSAVAITGSSSGGGFGLAVLLEVAFFTTTIANDCSASISAGEFLTLGGEGPAVISVTDPLVRSSLTLVLHDVSFKLLHATNNVIQIIIEISFIFLVARLSGGC